MMDNDNDDDDDANDKRCPTTGEYPTTAITTIQRSQCTTPSTTMTGDDTPALAPLVMMRRGNDGQGNGDKVSTPTPI